MHIFFNFVDIRKMFLEECNISKILSFGKVKKGINIIGRCNFKKCKAFKQKVISPFKGKEIFKMSEKLLNIICPFCGKIIVPLTVGFNHCEYLIDAIVIEDSEVKKFPISGKSDNINIIQYFNQDKCGSCMFYDLAIKVYI